MKESTTATVLKDLTGFAGIRERDPNIKKRVQRILEIKMASFRNCTLSISTALSLRKAVLIYVSEEAEDGKLMVVIEQTAGQKLSSYAWVQHPFEATLEMWGYPSEWPNYKSFYSRMAMFPIFLHTLFWLLSDIKMFQRSSRGCSEHPTITVSCLPVA